MDTAAALLVSLGLIGAAAEAMTVYKCGTAGGTPTYQESPCPAGQELRNFDLDPPTLSVVPGVDRAANPSAAMPEAAPPQRLQEKASPGRGVKKPRGDPAERRHAHAGMSEGELVAKLGRPDITAGGARKGKLRWTYLPAPGDPDTITTVYLDRGMVVDIERKLVKR